jgi:hypothetical protein
MYQIVPLFHSRYLPTWMLEGGRTCRKIVVDSWACPRKGGMTTVRFSPRVDVTSVVIVSQVCSKLDSRADLATGDSESAADITAQYRSSQRHTKHARQRKACNSLLVLWVSTGLTPLKYTRLSTPLRYSFMAGLLPWYESKHCPKETETFYVI